MERATPVQMRKALEVVEVMKKAGIRFVPMPVLDEADHAARVVEMQRRLGEIERTCESAPNIGEWVA